MMRIIEKVTEMQKLMDSLKCQGKTIGLVPTMGALHEGHLYLIKYAVRESDVVVVSIFVNPLQFGQGEDYKKYPRTLNNDSSLCEKVKVDVLFCPSVEEMYPIKPLTYIDMLELTDKLCGKSRAGHFRGVCTVVGKLFNIIKPHNAYFGQKDYQQFMVIKQMVDELNFSVKLKMCPIVREKDGLALSSRNRYLSPAERKQALCLKEALDKAKYLIRNQKEEKASNVINEMKKIIKRQPFSRIDYVEVCDSETLEKITSIKGKALVALAVFIGKTRLIDNDVIS